MKKTLQKRQTEFLSSAPLPRISVEVLESRTMLSAAHPLQHAHPSLQRAAIETIGIPTAQSVYITLLPTGSSNLSVVGLASNHSAAWRLDGQGRASITGTVFQLSGDGTTTAQGVSFTPGGNSDDSKDNNGDGSGNCPHPPTGSGPSGSTTGGKPTGTPTGTPTIARPTPPGATGPQQGPTPATPSPAPGQDGGSAQPSISRPTPSTDPTGGNTSTPAGPTVTPLAMTPAGAGFSPLPTSNLMPGSSNIPSVPHSMVVSSTGATSTLNLPAAHDMPHAPAFATLAAITPPINFLIANLPTAAAAAAPVQAATANVHVSDIVSDVTATGTYVFASAAPSLPARIAYNFVRLDAAAFNDAAGAFAAELAAMNVSTTDKSHTRAWAITAGVLAVDAALLVYWHRQAKKRKLLQQEAQAIPI